jgi:hypothetical protein
MRASFQTLQILPMRALLAAVALVCGGCEESAGLGDVQVFLRAEESLVNGVVAGDGNEDLSDGWSVAYERFVVVVGDARARSNDTDETLRSSEPVIVDLLTVPSSGYELARFHEVEAVRWHRFGYDLVRASNDAVLGPGVTAAERADMAAAGVSLWVRATMTNPAGESCSPGTPSDCAPNASVTVDWQLDAATSFDDCADESGNLGFAVVAGGTAQVEPTIHGDHWFFSDVTLGAESTMRRAQWIADCDLDRDGATTLDELRQVWAAEVFPPGLYSLTGSLVPIATAYDFLEAQARTLGDYQGAGECPTREVLP